MTNEFTIRPARVEDAATLLELILALATYEKLAHEVVATKADLARTLFGERPGAEVLLAQKEGEGHLSPKALGYALFFPTYSTFLARPGLWLEDLFVLPEHRGQGLGQALLGGVAARASETPGGRLEWSVLDWNTPAIRFYERLGARPLPEWTTFRITGAKLSDLARRAGPAGAQP